jgi:hypothetical protein
VVSGELECGLVILTHVCLVCQAFTLSLMH